MIRTAILNFSFFSIFILNSCLLFAQADSSAQPKPSAKIMTWNLSLSGTFSAQNNWYNDENNYKSISFLFNGDYNYRFNTTELKQNYSFRSALGYLKVIDSIWVKNNDYWRVNATIIENRDKRFAHTYAFIARSQFLKTYAYSYNYQADRQEKELRSAFFNPASMIINYGLSWTFWDDNFINFNFAAINFSTKPRFNNKVLPNDHELAKTKKMYLYADYGMNIQASITKRINENTEWENYSYFFANGINKHQVNLDFSNRISFRFLKYMLFRIDNHIIYDPLYSSRLQYQNDFVIGLILHKQVKK